MGTRHLTLVVLNQEYKVAQYGQWDGYPSSAGAIIVNFLREVINKGDLDRFTSRISQCSFLKENQLQEILRNDPELDKNPQFSRDTGCGVLELILHSPGGILLSSHVEFAADSLMCEYAYVIDLDKQRLEVYRGFNTEPIESGERFFTLSYLSERKHKDLPSENKYYPIRLACWYDFNNLPDKEKLISDVEDFDKTFNGYEDEEEEDQI